MMRGITFGSCLYSVWTWSAVQVAWSLQWHFHDYVIRLPDRILQSFAVVCKLGLPHMDYQI